MLFEIALRGERFGAVRALKWLVARMNLLVPDQVAHLGEGLVAAGMVAGVGPLPVVHASVLLEGRALGEGLVALLAAELPPLVGLLVVL